MAILGVAALLAFAFRDLAVDDAFITYRYALNLAQGRGFVYNAGEPILSTTAPLYALLLAAVARGGLDVPIVSNLIGAASIGVGALCLLAIARRRGELFVGWLAAMLYVLDPLLWLALGLETAFQLALILAAFAALEFGRPGLAGLALGAAFVTRYDAALPAAIWVASAWFQVSGFRFHVSRPAPRALARLVLAASLIAVPVLLFLTLTFGSPIPATLAAKRAQTALGVTGFYAGTSYLEGLLILLRGWFAQTWLYALPALAFAIGVGRVSARVRWVAPFVLWAGAHIVAYSALGVAPYFWYYAPLVPASVLFIAQGVTTANRHLRSIVGGLVLIPFLLSLMAIWHAPTAPLPDPQSDTSKVLPEAKVSAYRRAGEWLAANTPPEATIGMTEVGVIGFYAQRTTIDFLGLLQPEVARALGGGDAAWTLFHYQPDYLALTAVHPMYNFDPRGDAWFLTAYQPIQRFDDARFWGSPVVVYRRVAPRATVSDTIASNATRVNARFGDSIELLAIEPSADAVRAGEALTVRLWWRAAARVERDYTVTAQLLGQHDLIIAQRDTPPGLGARSTSTWATGQIVSDLVLIGIPPTACAPAVAQLNLALYDARTGARLRVDTGEESFRWGRVEVLSASSSGLRFTDALTLTGYALSPRLVAPGDTLDLTLRWQTGAQPVEGLRAFVHLVSDADGQKVAQADGAPVLRGDDRRALRVPSDASPGVYRVLVGVYRSEDGVRLPRVDAVGQPLGDHVALCPVRVR